jgi:glycosyltransferase involved in cell wall biosynthesis
MQVTFFHRKKRANANFSIEFIFDEVRKRLAGQVEARVHVAPCFSNGLLRRLAIAIDARRHQGAVNHVTGDINFAGILLDPRRTVLTSHDCSYLQRTKGIRHRLLKFFWVDLPVKRARFVTTVSEAAKKDLLTHTRCDPKKVLVIHNPIADDFVSRPKEFNHVHPRILQIGTATNKNVPRLIDALQGIPCTLVIVGTLDKQLSSVLQQRQIQYENYANLSRAEIMQQYELADLVAFVSTIEGFGLPIVESHAVGRPVVTSNVSSMPEVAGDAACLVDPYDVSSIRAGVARVISDEAYRTELISKGYQNAKRFHADTIAQQYLEVYRQIWKTTDL